MKTLDSELRKIFDNLSVSMQGNTENHFIVYGFHRIMGSYVEIYDTLDEAKEASNQIQIPNGFKFIGIYQVNTKRVY